MKLKGIIVVFFAGMMSLAAIAGEQAKEQASDQAQRVEIKIKTDDGQGEATKFSFASADDEFRLQDLQLGESRSFVDADGNTLYVVRTEDGFDMDVNGKKVSIPDVLEDIEVSGDHHGDEEHRTIRIKKKVVIDEQVDETI